MKRFTLSSDQDREPNEPDLFFQQEASPYQPDEIATGKGALPPFIRYMSHVIIWGSVGYVCIQAESNIINHLASALLVLWSIYNLIALKKRWPPFP